MAREKKPFQLVLLLLLWAEPAWAVQVHGHPEGYIGHMMAHVFFSAAIIFFLYMIYKKPPGHGSAWGYLRLSLLLFLFWNIDTFTVHLLSHLLPDDAIVPGRSLASDMLLVEVELKSILYYLGRFDHLICVPAMWFLMCALIDFCSDTEKKLKQKSTGARP